MAAAKNPAHAEGLPHSKFTSKSAMQVRQRIEAKRQKLTDLRAQRQLIDKEINELIKKDTIANLAAEFAVSKTTIERIAYYASYWRK